MKHFLIERTILYIDQTNNQIVKILFLTLATKKVFLIYSNY